MSNYTAENLVRDYAAGDKHDADAALKRGQAVYKAVTAGMSVRQIAEALSAHYGYKVSSSTIGNLSLAYKALVAFGFTTGRDANLAMRAVIKVQNIAGGPAGLQGFLGKHENTEWENVNTLVDALTELKSTVTASRQETVTRAQKREGAAGDTEQQPEGNGSSSGVPVENHAQKITVKDLAQNLSTQEIGQFLRAIAKREFTAQERQSIERAMSAITKEFAKADASALATA